MKTRLIYPAMFIIGLATAPLMAKSIIPTGFFNQIEMIKSQDKVKIDPANLPVPVKEGIIKDEELKALKIMEAWKVSGEKTPSHFVIKFDNKGEELVKKYTALGDEIED